MAKGFGMGDEGFCVSGPRRREAGALLGTAFPWAAQLGAASQCRGVTSGLCPGSYLVAGVRSGEEARREAEHSAHHPPPLVRPAVLAFLHFSELPGPVGSGHTTPWAGVCHRAGCAGSPRSEPWRPPSSCCVHGPAEGPPPVGFCDLGCGPPCWWVCRETSGSICRCVGCCDGCPG